MLVKNSKCQSGIRPAICCLIGFCILSAFGLFWFRASGSWNYLAVLVATVPLAIGVIYAHSSGLFKSHDRVFKAYAAILAVFCLIFVFIIPPMSSPDEGHHFFSSYWLSDVAMGEASLDSGDDFPVRSDVVEMYSSSSMGIGSSAYRTVFDSFSLFAGSGATEQVTQFDFNVGSENVFAKIPSVIGILIARVLNLGAYPLFYLGRLCAALFFIACSLVAVRIVPVAKAAFMGGSLLPMTLQLAGSYSYDCGIIALSFLLSAVLLRAIFSEEIMSSREAIGLVVLAALVAPLKIVYISILILILFIPQRRFVSRRHAVLFKVAIPLSAFIAVLLIRLASVVSLVDGGSGGSLDYRGVESGSFYTIGDLITNPLGTVALFLRTFDSMADFYIESMVGALPGWLQANLKAPNLLVYAYFGCLLFSIQKTPDDDQSISPWMRAAICIAFALTFLGISLSMAIGWTFNTEGVIQGVQGRYLLPLLPIFLFALRSVDVEIKKSPADTCLSVITFLNVIYIMRFAALAFALP